jgi:hypothetical protein
VGTYAITVALKSNKDVKTTYNVTVAAGTSAAQMPFMNNSGTGIQPYGNQGTMHNNNGLNRGPHSRPGYHDGRLDGHHNRHIGNGNINNYPTYPSNRGVGYPNAGNMGTGYTGYNGNMGTGYQGYNSGTGYRGDITGSGYQGYNGAAGMGNAGAGYGGNYGNYGGNYSGHMGMARTHNRGGFNSNASPINAPIAPAM